MLSCIKAFNELTSHFDSLGAFLTKEEFNHGQNLAKRFFDAYQDLNDWAASQNRKMFNITFKFHAAMHMFKNCEFLNYRAHQNFRAEDFVGKISQLGHSCSFGVKASRISCKLMDKYRIQNTSLSRALLLKMMSLDKRFGLSLVPHSLLTKKGKGYAVSHHFLFDKKKIKQSSPKSCAMQSGGK